MAEQADIYRDFADFYDLYVGDQQSDLPLYLQWAKQANGPILEVGAGSGRLTLPIARAGCRVTAVDVSPAMLERLQRRLQREPDDVQDRTRVVLADMRDLDLGEAFDLVVVPFYTFNYVLTREDQRRALRSLTKHVSDAGRLVIDVFLPLGRIRNCPEEPVLKVHQFDLRTGKTVRGWNTYRIDRQRQIETRRHLFEVARRNGTIIRKEFVTQRRYSFPTELDALFAGCGLQKEDVLSGSGDMASGGSERLIYVLRKRTGDTEAPIR